MPRGLGGGGFECFDPDENQLTLCQPMRNLFVAHRWDTPGNYFTPHVRSYITS